MSIAANDPTASETGPDDGQYTVTLSKASSTDTTIDLHGHRHGRLGRRLHALSGSVTITAGNTTATIDLAALDDAIVEASETVIVTLDSVTAGDPQITIDGGANQATVTIADDDTATVSIAANDASAVGDRPRQRPVHGHALQGQQHRHHDQLHGDRHGRRRRRLHGPLRHRHDHGRQHHGHDRPGRPGRSIVEASETVIVTLDSITAGDPQITIDGGANRPR